ncbi:MAG: translation initiation factor IF-2 [Candidatus Krumholzibacteriia bacterium]
MARKLRVYELAKHYGVESPTIMAILRQMKAEAKSHMSVVEDDAVDRIHARFQRERELARLNYARAHGLDPEKLKHVASLRELPRPEPAAEEEKAPEAPTKKAPARKAQAKNKIVIIKKAGTRTAVTKAKAKTRERDETSVAERSAARDTKVVKKLVRRSLETPPPAPPEPAPPEIIAVPESPAPASEATTVAAAPDLPVAPPAPPAAVAPVEAAPEAPVAGEEPAAAAPAEAPAEPARPAAPVASVRRGARIVRLGPGAPMKTTYSNPRAALIEPGVSGELPVPGEVAAAGLGKDAKDSVKESVKAAIRKRKDAKAQEEAEQVLRKRVRHRRKKIDEAEVAKNVKQTLAQIETGPGRRHRARRPDQAEEAVQEGDLLRVTEFITVQQMAEKLEVQARDVIGKLFALGIMATINQRLDRDQIEMVASEFERDVEFLEEEDEIIAEEEILPEDLVHRAPVVTVMGHVDHGKTSLLDTIRRTNVIAGEVGGITQHIGAYRVETPGGPITFLDTPGHEAFTAMRARGAQVTDIVILVVAADDRIMPQTIEAINHAKAAGVPLIIAINKIDLPGARPDLVKQDLLQHGIVVEDFGGQALSAEISAKKNLNVDKLLDLVHLQAEVLELTASPKGHARGTVVEASKEPGRGVLFTVLIDKGTLKVGDNFVSGMQDGKVRALQDERGDALQEVGPGEPAVVMGANDVPEAGDRFNVVENEREARDIATRRRTLQRQQQQARPKRQVNLDNLAAMISSQALKELPIIVKGDVAGSVEALCDQLLQLNTEEVQIKIVHKAVGAVTESDVLLAANTGAMIVGFHLRPGSTLREKAKQEGVTIEVFDIIYEAVDTLKKAMAGLLGTIEREVPTGSAEVRQVFTIPKIGQIAGAYVTNGSILRNSRARLVRNEVMIFEGKINSLKRFKEDAREVQTGFECGVGLENFHDLQSGDVIETYRIEEIVRTEL